MIRYLYNRQTMPPAPFVHVSLRNLDGTRELRDVPAQLDTAADRTVVPLQWAISLGLVPVRLVTVEGFDGHRIQISTFVLQMALRQGPILEIEVLSAHILLGRDVLNLQRFVLDGPQLALEIE